MVDDLPFTQIVKDGYCLRVFKPDVDSEELKWHFDETDRKITVIKSEGWMFQLDNKLPFILSNGDVINIKANEYHRCIKGNGNLIIKFKSKLKT